MEIEDLYFTVWGQWFGQEWKLNDNSESETNKMDITTRKRKNSDNCEMNVSKIRKNQERVTKYRKSLLDEKKLPSTKK